MRGDLLVETSDPLERALLEAADSMRKASQHEPVGHGGRNWITRMKEQLPAYIQHIANDLREKRGKDESSAIRLAIGIVKRWARGGGKVQDSTRAAAAKAVAEWEKLKGKAAALRGKKLSEAAYLSLEGFLEEWGAELTAEELALVEAYAPPAILAQEFPDELTDELIGDLSVLEAATKPTPTSNLKQQPGESLHSYGVRLKADDARLAAAQKTTKGKTRSGAAATSFEKLHPRGRGGKWVLKSGDSGQQVRNAQAIVGVKADGKFGAATTAAVRAYQKRHGLKVDGVIGAQTLAQMNGQDGKKVKPGLASGTIRKPRKGKLMHSPLDDLKFTLDDSEVGDLSLLEAPAADAEDAKDKGADEANEVSVKCPSCNKQGKMTKAGKCPNCGSPKIKPVAEAAAKMKKKAA